MLVAKPSALVGVDANDAKLALAGHAEVSTVVLALSPEEKAQLASSSSTYGIEMLRPDSLYDPG